MAVDVYRYKNVMIIGKKNLITDVKGILVGNSHDDEVKTGVSVLTSDERFAASVSVLGGAPGTRETDLLESDKFCLLYTSPSPRDISGPRMPSSA